MLEDQQQKVEKIKEKIKKGILLENEEYDFCDMNKQFFKNIKFVRTKKMNRRKHGEKRNEKKSD